MDSLKQCSTRSHLSTHLSAKMRVLGSIPNVIYFIITCVWNVGHIENCEILDNDKRGNCTKCDLGSNPKHEIVVSSKSWIVLLTLCSGMFKLKTKVGFESQPEALFKKLFVELSLKFVLQVIKKTECSLSWLRHLVKCYTLDFLINKHTTIMVLYIGIYFIFGIHARYRLGCLSLF